MRLIDTRDRAQVFLNGNHIVTQYQEEIGDDIQVNFTSEESQLDILVENMGRVNYGHKLTAPSQHKGIGRGVMLDLHFVNQWETYPLSMNSIKNLKYSSPWREGVPSFYEFKFHCLNPEDTYMDMSGFGKELPSLTAIILVDFGILDQHCHFIFLGE